MTDILIDTTNGVMTITLNRVDKKNSITADMYASMADGLPGLWVFGGRLGADTPPYQGVEFYPLAYPPVVYKQFLPILTK